MSVSTIRPCSETGFTGAVNVNGEIFVRLEMSNPNSGYSESILVSYNSLNLDQQSFVNSKWLYHINDTFDENNRMMDEKLHKIEELIEKNGEIISSTRETLKKGDAILKKFDNCLSKMDQILGDNIQKNHHIGKEVFIEKANDNFVPSQSINDESILSRLCSWIKGVFYYFFYSSDN